MANAITAGRLVALFVLIGAIGVGGPATHGVAMLGLIAVFAADGLDGWVARRRNETSTFGAVFDIAGDRIVENALWIAFAYWGLLPLWVPLLLIARGFLVDGIRSVALSDGRTPFGTATMMRFPLTTWLTAGRFMRGTFGVAKAAGFVFLAGLHGWTTLDTTGTWLGALDGVDALHVLG